MTAPHTQCQPDIMERLRSHFAHTGITKSDTFDLVNEAADLIERLTAWQPIEAAPRDGTSVLLLFPGNLRAIVGYCEKEYWGDLDSDFCFEPFSVKPTHWMPLPPPPAMFTKFRTDREGGWNAGRALATSLERQKTHD